MGTPGQAKNTQRKQEGQLRRAEILRLKTSGLSDAAIAERLRISTRTVARHLQRALSEAVSAATESYRAVESLRLDALIHAYWQKALDGDLPAAHLVSKVIGQRMALFGLVQPPTRGDDIGDLFAALIRRMADERVVEAAARPDDVPLDAVVESAQPPVKPPAWALALRAAGYDAAEPMPPND